jgi:amidohydrolase
LDQVRAAAKELLPEVIQWRRRLHAIPEVGAEVPKTAHYVAEELEKLGATVTRGVGGHGVVALVRGGRMGRCLAVRADMDALLIQERTGLPYASGFPGYMHACGHDAHMAIALGTAKLLLARQAELAGTVKFIFQPAEEGPGGALPMIQAGVLEDPMVEAIVALHAGTLWKEVAGGKVGVRSGPMMAALDRFDLRIQGRGGHGAAPHEAIDATYVATQVVSALQAIVAREVKPVDPAVVTVGKLLSGTAYNIIADSAVIEGTARSLSHHVRELLARRIGDIATSVAAAHRAECTYKYTYGYPPLVNHAGFTQLVAQTAQQLLGRDNVVELPEPTMGGEDMAYFLEKVPGTFFFLSTRNEAKGIVHGHHHPQFDIDEDVLWVGVACLAGTALTWQR